MAALVLKGVIMKISNILIFIAGASIGAFAGYTYADKKLSDKYTKSLKAARQHYQEKLEEGYKRMGIMVADIPAEATLEPIPEEINTEYKDTVEREDYCKYSKEDKVEKPVTKKEPYQVSENEYDDLKSHDHIELTYFTEDKTVMDTKENVWPDGLTRLGVTNVDDIVNNELDEVFIVNDDYSEAYHVTVEEGSYNDYMSGYDG